MIRRTCLCLCVATLTAFAVPGEAATRTVCASGCAYTDLQAAIDAAVFGDVILLRAGQTYVGHFRLRVKSGSGVIQIRSDAPDASLPAAGERLVPGDGSGGTTSRSLLPRIVGRGGAYITAPLLRTDPGAHGYVVRFIEFDGTAHLGNQTLIQLGEDTAVTPPYDITLDRVYIHGHPYKGQKRGVSINGKRLSILNSYISKIMAVNADSQAIAGWNGAGPFTIENNYLEAAGENLMFGGGVPAITNLVPSDIVLRRNHFFKPTAWRGSILATPASVRASAAGGGRLSAGTHYFRVVAVMATATTTAVSAPSAQVSASVASGGSVSLSWGRVPGADKYRVYRGTSSGRQTVYLQTTATSFTYTGASELSGSPPSSGTRWVVKNSIELKNAQRLVAEGNVVENNWAAGQAGYAIMLTPRASGNAPWTRVQDITFTNNIIRRVPGVVNITGYDDTRVSQRTERITFRNNLFEDVDTHKYGTNAKALQMGGGAATLVFDSNTIIHNDSAVLYAYGASMPGFVYTNNISIHGYYGVMGDGSSTGSATLTKYFPGAVFRCNVLAGGSASRYPSPNGFPTLAQWTASFVNAAAGDYRLIPGSPVALAGCSGVTPGADLSAVAAAVGGSAPDDDPEPAPTPVPDPENEPPVADAGGPYAAAVGATVAADGTASVDPDGSVLDYLWQWGDEILVRAADLPATARHGSEWTRVVAADAAGGAMLLNPDKGAAKRSTALASPTSYVEFTVNAAAGVPYYLWMRLRATSDRYTNDSLYIQFSGAVNAQGSAVARIGTSAALPIILEEKRDAWVAGWGWTDSVYGGVAPPIYFSKSGLQTVRIQKREDGVAWDQLVLSTVAFRTSPGAFKRDTTILDAEIGTSTGSTAAHRYSKAGAYPVRLVVTDAAGASDAAATTATIK